MNQFQYHIGYLRRSSGFMNLVGSASFFAMVIACLLSHSSSHAQTYADITADASKPSLNVVPPQIDFSVSTPSVMLSDKNLRYGLKLRYQALPNLGFEANYSLLRAGQNATSIWPVPVNYGAPVSKAKGYGLDLVGTLPVLDRLSLSGRAGIQGVRSDTNFLVLGNIDSAAPRLFSQARFGLGVQYALTKSVGLRLEMERFYRLSNKAYSAFGSDFSADNVSLGLQFRF